MLQKPSVLSPDSITFLQILFTQIRVDSLPISEIVFYEFIFRVFLESRFCLLDFVFCRGELDIPIASPLLFVLDAVVVTDYGFLCDVVTLFLFIQYFDVTECKIDYIDMPSTVWKLHFPISTHF